MKENSCMHECITIGVVEVVCIMSTRARPERRYYIQTVCVCVS